jgi:hypothetical protein
MNGAIHLFSPISSWCAQGQLCTYINQKMRVCVYPHPWLCIANDCCIYSEFLTGICVSDSSLNLEDSRNWLR